MKKRWVLWWIANIVWIAIFSVVTFVIWTRKVDAAGVIQTHELKLASFMIWLIAFIFPVVIQVIWLIINFRVGTNKKLNSSSKAGFKGIGVGLRW